MNEVDNQSGEDCSLPTPFDNAPIPERDEVFWGWHDFILFASLTVLALGLSMLGGAGIHYYLHVSETRMNIVMMLGQMVAYAIAFTALKYMFQAEYGEPLLSSLGWRPAGIDAGRLLLIGLGQAFSIALLSTLMNIRQLDNPMNRLLADLPTAIVVAVLSVTLGPLAEEFAFRGLLQPLLIRSIGVIPGIAATSLLFGLMHLQQYGAWQSVVLISLAGAGFGVMRHWTRSTRASVIMHAGYNSALFILFFAQKAHHA